MTTKAVAVKSTDSRGRVDRPEHHKIDRNQQGMVARSEMIIGVGNSQFMWRNGMHIGVPRALGSTVVLEILRRISLPN